MILGPRFIAKRALCRTMSTNSSTSKLIHFGPYEVTDQVFYNTPLCYALCNIKPILPGHVLVIPYRQVPRLTDLTPAEVSDLFATVQKVQRMLALTYFEGENIASKLKDGSFNVAIQDGPESGQTVPHMHCHVIPRTKESSAEGDGFYNRLQGEEGNVGGGLWDSQRPPTVGKFPQIKDEDRHPRDPDVMRKEAVYYRSQMDLVD